MEVESIISELSGAELRDIKILSDCIVNGAREICITIKVRFHDCAARQNRIARKDYIATWLSRKFKTQKPSAYERLESTVNNQVLPAFGGMFLDEISTEYAQSILDDYADYYSYSTLTKVYQCLNAVLKDAQRPAAAA